MSLVKDFKDFVTKGNVVDLAVGVIIGSAFGGIVTSLVKDVITPIIALILTPIGGQPDFSKYALFAHKVTKDGKEVLEGGIMYGSFLNALVSFLIIAAVIFLVFVKPMAKLKAVTERKAAAAPPPPTPPEIVLLTEIRDLLKKQ